MVRPVMNFQFECKVTSNGVFLAEFCAVTHALIARPKMENRSPNSERRIERDFRIVESVVVLEWSENDPKFLDCRQSRATHFWADWKTLRTWNDVPALSFLFCRPVDLKSTQVQTLSSQHGAITMNVQEAMDVDEKVHLAG